MLYLVPTASNLSLEILVYELCLGSSGSPACLTSQLQFVPLGVNIGDTLTVLLTCTSVLFPGCRLLDRMTARAMKIFDDDFNLSTRPREPRDLRSPPKAMARSERALGKIIDRKGMKRTFGHLPPLPSVETYSITSPYIPYHRRDPPPLGDGSSTRAVTYAAVRISPGDHEQPSIG